MAEMSDRSARRWAMALLLGVLGASAGTGLAGQWACGHQQEQATAMAPAATAPEQPAAEKPAAEKRGVEVATELMAQWKRQHPNRDWIEKEQETHVIVKPADNSDLVGDPQGHAYGRITALDVKTWERETLRLVTDGSRIFHSADALGSTIGVSCDMCHPDAANTHPETYPKFQVQMGKVALLRDMINWCIEQASRGPRLEADDPKMRALEAYIYAQRKGTPLIYGKR